MNTPPNPHVAEACAAMKQHNAQFLAAPPRDDEELKRRIFERWPDMLKYADTARIERLHHADGWCWGVTVTI